MNAEQMVLVKEGLKLADDALAVLMKVDNDSVKRIANMLHAAVWFGEMVLGGVNK